jgi:hypothetical protein
VRRMRRHRTLLIHPLILLAFLANRPGVALAQDGGAEIPENAHAKSYGRGWECDHGYRASDEACVAVKGPENGYLTASAYGPGWQCDRGYRAVDEACVAIKVPENGYLADSASEPIRRGKETVKHCARTEKPPTRLLDRRKQGDAGLTTVL